jgi:RNA polymerase sigma-54 factor
MTLRQRLDQRLVQKLVLAPALQQAIKLLPLTNLELIEVIDAELSENPMIEIAGESLDRASGEAGQAAEELKAEKGAAEELEIRKTKSDDTAVESKAEDEMASGFQEYLDDGFRPHFYETKEAVSLENTLSRPASLWDHLNWQAGLTFQDAEDLRVAREVIGDINEDGYMESSVEELARLARTTPERVNAVREVIKTFDPAGVGSLDLKEVLLAQMDSLGIDDEVARTIVTCHLPLIERSDFAGLSKVLNIQVSEVKSHFDLIRSLDPKPGRKFTAEKTTYVVPDIVVSREDGEWKVTVNDEGLPPLRISPYYRRLLSQAMQGEPEAQRYLKDQLKKAMWFLRSLEQRRGTIFKVAQFIVAKQREFLEKGLDYIKPLTLMEIAQDIGVHESTVGRVVANKYMTTPQGVFPLKYFFHKSLTGTYGEEVSSLKIKDRIKRLVDGEDRANPLSDIEIGDLLERENLRIARRTVAKYRKQLKIEPSHIRKRKSVMEEGA